ncbi:MAG: RNA pyrophosphohydrolase [Campylobacter sp.]
MKQYRPNVSAVILSPKYPFTCEILIAQRIDIAGAWQFPQGGIDKGETPKEAILRELKEEIGTNDVEILSAYPEWLSYDFPKNTLDKMKPYAGQKQKYFLVKLRNLDGVSTDTKVPEFSDFKFVKSNEIFKYVTSFKKDIYLEVLKYFRKEGFLC